MATAKDSSRALFSDRDTEVLRVRDKLIVKLTETKIYEAGEQVEMTYAQYLRHAHQVETEDQYQARLKLIKELIKEAK